MRQKTLFILSDIFFVRRKKILIRKKKDFKIKKVLDKGVLATNAQLVERVIGIIERMGAKVLTPQQARNKLGLFGADTKI